MNLQNKGGTSYLDKSSSVALAAAYEIARAVEPGP